MANQSASAVDFDLLRRIGNRVCTSLAEEQISLDRVVYVPRRRTTKFPNHIRVSFSFILQALKLAFEKEKNITVALNAIDIFLREHVAALGFSVQKVKFGASKRNYNLCVLIPWTSPFEPVLSDLSALLFPSSQIFSDTQEPMESMGPGLAR